MRTRAGAPAAPSWPRRAGRVVFGAGNADAELMFVGEAPGANEDQQGLPFVGQAGKLLERLLGEIGLDRAEVFIANVLKCRPPDNRDPQPREIENCTGVSPSPGRADRADGDLHARQLRDQAAARRPHRASPASTGGPRWRRSDRTRSACIPIYHPAAALYTPPRSRRCARTSTPCRACWRCPLRRPPNADASLVSRAVLTPDARSRRRSRGRGRRRPAAGAVLSGATGVRDRRAGRTEALGATLAGAASRATSLRCAASWGRARRRRSWRLLGESASRAPVTSPTFAIAHRYSGAGVVVAHLDLYRLGGLDSEDPDLLGDYLGEDRITFVEWPPEGGGELGGPPRLIVELAHLDGERRRVRVSP